MNNPMPKDNEVDEKVRPVAWQWLDTSNFRKNIPSAAIREHWNPLYSAATVAELRARADAAERRVGELEADARRYRYLRDNANPDSDEGFAVTTEAMKGWGEWRTVHISGADLDSAIDTATGANPT